MADKIVQLKDREGNNLYPSLPTGTVIEELLWENASPSSSFAPQNISVNLTGYDGVKVIFKRNTSSTDNMLYTDVLDLSGDGLTLVPTGIAGNAQFVTGVNGKIYAYYRPYVVSESFIEIKFQYCYYTSPSEDISNVSYCIPYKIYGIKTV